MTGRWNRTDRRRAERRAVVGAIYQLKLQCTWPGTASAPRFRGEGIFTGQRTQSGRYQHTAEQGNRGTSKRP